MFFSEHSFVILYENYFAIVVSNLRQGRQHSLKKKKPINNLDEINKVGIYK